MRHHLFLLPLGLAGLSAVAAAQGPGRVVVNKNLDGANEIAVYSRSPQGLLTFDESLATGGEGTGEDLGSQGAVAISSDRKWLLACNAGSDEVSLFRVTGGNVTLEDVVGSGGDFPISVAIHEDLVYVLNAGTPNRITGFLLEGNGPNATLEPIPGSTRALSAANTQPAQIAFSPTGYFLVVTEKATNRIVSFSSQGNDLYSEADVFPSAGVTPFGFAFHKNSRLIVSEAFNGAANASAVSSYFLDDSPDLTVIDESVPTTETAACWVALPKGQKFAYVSNTGSDTITGYALDAQSHLTRLDADGVTATTGDNPVDLAFSRDGKYLYQLNSHDGTISAYRRLEDGSLDPLGKPIGGLPEIGASGLIAY